MKAFPLALAFSCLLSQLTVGAFAVEQYVSETRSSAGTMAANASLTTPGFAGRQSSRALANEACALLNAAQFEAAENKLRSAIAIEPGLASAHCNLGLLLNKTGRVQEAIPHLELAHRLAPDAAAPLVTLAAAHQICGELGKAISLYSQYLERFPAAPDREVIADIVSHLRLESDQTENCGNVSSGNLHWAKKHLKVFVYRADGLNGFRPVFNELLLESFLSWGESGALSFEFVNDAQEADIECCWTDNVSKLSSVGEGGEAVMRHRGSVVTHARLSLLTSRPSNQTGLSEREVKALCLHEIGHALGLMKHSARPDDVMYCTLSSAAAPSAHDLSNLLALYAAN
jgi:tetratricopeptide (TPR) repeat protein